MAKKESLVEEAFIQIKNLEESLNENAKGILASTMKEEISSLVKESLNEQEEEDEIDLDAEVDTDADNEEVDMDMGMDMEDEESDEEGLEDEMEIPMDMDTDDDTIDLTGASDEEILRVFKAMSDEDGIIVKKDDEMLHLSDDNEDVEYIIQLGESDEEQELDEMYDEEEDMDFESMDDEDMDFESMDDEDMDFEEEDELFEMFDEEEEEEEEEYSEGVIYELELDSEMSDKLGMNDEEDYEEDYDEEEEDEYVMEASKFKAKGMGIGNASKFKYDKKPNQGEGFKTKMKQGTRGVGMGKAKFEYKEEVNNSGVEKKKTKKPMVKKAETKEASRTYGNGSKEGRGLRKGITPNRNLTFESKTEELHLLREKNEEYRKALNLFRTKLNEVAVFNSNLAYATRLFTEHSTTKQEKINILRRFDNVETIKESKNLYRSIKDELSSSKGSENTITESFERTVVKTPSSGSATNLIESKTYENPQFLRMKDLMTKIK
jgi:DNA-directed RNA polymerase subunit delta